MVWVTLREEQQVLVHPNPVISSHCPTDTCLVKAGDVFIIFFFFKKTELEINLADVNHAPVHVCELIPELTFFGVVDHVVKLQALVRLNGNLVTLIDTGGISDSQNEMDKLVSKKALSILDKSHIILFLLDAKNVSGEDEILIHNFRKYTDKIILVINKVDDTSHDVLIWNYYSYGFKKVCPISASHGRGIGELEEEIVALLKQKGLYSEQPTEISNDDEYLDFYKDEDKSTDDIDIDNLDEIENQVKNQEDLAIV